VAKNRHDSGADAPLEFVLAEIALGVTLAKTASTRYKYGLAEHGDLAKADAIKAVQTAKQFIGKLNPEGQLIAQAELAKLEQAVKLIIPSGRAVPD
jgi:hypothetical protein